MKYKVGMVSLGCPKNLVDTETMLGLLTSEKYEITNKEKFADIIIINTCGFIEAAKTESIETIIEMAKYKTEGNCKLLIVTGCLAQRYKDEIIKEIPEVDCVVGTGKYHEIVNIIDKSISREGKIVECGCLNTELDQSFTRLLTTPSYTAYLKIADGCDNCCTYCIIPKLRGKYRSRKIETIINEAEKLALNGVKELILIAQDTTNYGIDLYGSYMLPYLLKELCKIEAIKWIRVHYCYPERVSDELIDVISREEKICNYFDIPIQHINDSILKKMGRKVNRKQITGLINKIRERIPDAVLRTSLIVGFPGETDSQFNELLNFVREIKFDRVGIFGYSREESTSAYNFDNQVKKSIIDKRYNKTMSLQENISQEINRCKLFKVYNVLVEGHNPKLGMYYGRTYADSPDIDCMVFFTSAKNLKAGDFVSVTIKDTRNYDLIGECSNELCK